MIGRGVLPAAELSETAAGARDFTAWLRRSTADRRRVQSWPGRGPTFARRALAAHPHRERRAPPTRRARESPTADSARRADAGSAWKHVAGHDVLQAGSIFIQATCPQFGHGRSRGIRAVRAPHDRPGAQAHGRRQPRDTPESSRCVRVTRADDEVVAAGRARGGSRAGSALFADPRPAPRADPSREAAQKGGVEIDVIRRLPRRPHARVLVVHTARARVAEHDDLASELGRKRPPNFVRT